MNACRPRCFCFYKLQLFVLYSPQNVVHKNRSIKFFCVGVCREEICGFLRRELFWLRFRTQKIFLSHTQQHLREISLLLRLRSFRSYTQRRVRAMHIRIRQDAGAKRHNFQPRIKSLSAVSRGEFRRFSLSQSFFQFARKLRWFLLAPFINSFYQLERNKNPQFFHSARPPGCVVIFWKIIQCNSFHFAQWTVQSRSEILFKIQKVCGTFIVARRCDSIRCLIKREKGWRLNIQICDWRWDKRLRRKVSRWAENIVFPPFRKWSRNFFCLRSSLNWSGFRTFFHCSTNAMKF